MALYSLAYSVVLIVGLYFVRKLILTKSQLPLPPGPKGLPLVGNITDLPPPAAPEWKHWINHKDLYGPLSSVTVLGQTIVLIHDKEVAFELLDKRAVKYSSRPWFVFASEMIGYSGWMAFQPNNKNLRQQRKLAAGQIGSKASVARFYAAMDVKARRFLLRTLNQPENVVGHLQTQSSSIMLEMLFGYTPSPQTRDPLVDLINQVMEEFSLSMIAGAWAVDLIPWLRHLPSWLPGMDFKRTAQKHHDHFKELLRVPMEFVTQQMAQGKAKPSFVSRLLDENLDAEERGLVTYCASALYAGGADTTVALLHNFFKAMTLFPEIQVKAQLEIDRVAGMDRLPSFEDRNKLPYIEAVVKETMRWQPIAPLGLPHMSDQDDEYRGYRIPKGAIILASIQSFAHDPEEYPDPAVFRPERFLRGRDGETQVDPYSYAFGFGRRICPGRLLADANLWLTIAHVLAVFDIRKAVDEVTGQEIVPVVGSVPGVVAHPLPFKCNILARSEKHAELIRKAEIENPSEEGDKKFLSAISMF